MLGYVPRRSHAEDRSRQGAGSPAPGGMRKGPAPHGLRGPWRCHRSQACRTEGGAARRRVAQGAARGHGCGARLEAAGVMRTIYGLVDPRTDAVRYVGMTRNVSQRRSAHAWDAAHGSAEAANAKVAWLAEL